MSGMHAGDQSAEPAAGAHGPVGEPISERLVRDPALADGPGLSGRDVLAGPLGALYSVCVEHPCVTRPAARALWGVDVAPLYRAIRQIGPLDGLTVADVPCGAGVAFRALAPAEDVRYLAADPDASMLRRAERRARGRSLTQIEFRRAGLMALPFADAEVDVFLCFGALHLLDDLGAALAEIARCLSPGGLLVGTSFFSDAGARARRLFELRARRGRPLPPSREEMYKAIYHAGLVGGTLAPDYGYASFRARKPPDTARPPRRARRPKARSPHQAQRRP